MKNRKMSTATQRAKYVACDFVMSSIAFFLFDIYRFFELGRHSVFISLSDYLCSVKIVTEQILIPVGMLGIYWLSGYYNKPFKRSRLKELVTTVCSCLIVTFILYFGLLTNDNLYSRISTAETIGVLFSLLLAFVYTGRVLITMSTLERLRKHSWEFRTVIVGNSREAHQSAFELTKSNSQLGYNILTHVRIPGEKDMKGKEAIDLDALPGYCERNDIDQIIICTAHQDDNTVLNLLSRLYPLDIPIKIAPDTLTFLTSGIHMQDIYADPLIDLTSPRISEASKNVKRVMDICFSALALTVLSPLMALLAIGVKRGSPGPVFYKQERLGYLQRPFNIIKFRSMYVDAEASGPRLSSGTDSRITPLGRIMRKYRLDELPQFWNVIKGDMSLVGPRPEREYFIRQIVEQAPYYTMLQQVKPGITSWGMVKFGYASNVDEMVSRMRYDLIYLSNMSIIVDMKIMIHTVKTIITGRGV